jgi:small subunit ribosomal protein S2
MSLNITARDLLDAGVHFGHQLRRFNPRSKPFVFDNRHGISVIDLEKTYNCLEAACDFASETVANGGKILYVGTKKQAQEIVREAANSVQMPFCANRWMGGGLTNFVTIKASLKKYRKYLEMEADGSLSKLPGKEAAAIRRTMSRMHRNFEGLIEIDDLPDAMFIVDTNHEEIAVAEGNRVELPILAVVDTNSDPTKVKYPIPGNDDSIKSIRILVETVTEAIQEGLSLREERMSQRGEQRGSGAPTYRGGEEAQRSAEPIVEGPRADVADAPIPVEEIAPSPMATPAGEEAGDPEPIGRQEALQEVAEEQTPPVPVDATPESPEADAETEADKKD